MHIFWTQCIFTGRSIAIICLLWYGDGVGNTAEENA